MKWETADVHVEDSPHHEESSGEVIVSLHCLRVYLKKSYREALDLLSEMPHILEEIGLEPADLSNHSTLVKWFERIKTALW